MKLHSLSHGWHQEGKILEEGQGGQVTRLGQTWEVRLGQTREATSKERGSASRVSPHRGAVHMKWASWERQAGHPYHSLEAAEQTHPAVGVENRLTFERKQSSKMYQVFNVVTILFR